MSYSNLALIIFTNTNSYHTIIAINVSLLKEGQFKTDSQELSSINKVIVSNTG